MDGVERQAGTRVKSRSRFKLRLGDLEFEGVLERKERAGSIGSRGPRDESFDGERAWA